MYFSTIFSLLVTTSAAFAAPLEDRTACSPRGISGSEANRVKASFTASGVVPTLILDINPKVKVDVCYGNQFKITETLLAPTLSFSAEPDKDPATTKYTYFLLDPDVPQSDGAAGTGLRLTYLHWQVAHARPSCVKNPSPATIALYESLTPLSTSPHRYAFLVYRQPPDYMPEAVTPNLRAVFDVGVYAARGGLALVGGNFSREAATNM